MKARLIKRTVDGAKPNPDKDTFLWDESLTGFGLKVSRQGTKSYVLQYWRDGRSRRLTLGRHGAITPDQARRLAIARLAEVAQGKDPAQERQKAKQARTLAAFSEEFLTEYVEVRTKPRTRHEYRRLLEDVVLPALGTRKLTDITRADVARLHHQEREHPAQANKALAVLSRLFTVAEQWGSRPEGTNPCRGVERYKEGKRRRFLSGEELVRLGAVLAHHEPVSPECVQAVRLLLFTGCRLNEILPLRWQDVDFERGVIRLSDSKTGAKDVVLGAAALQLLADASREGEWVIPSPRRPGRHVTNLNGFWEKVRAEAEIEDVRLHDLRHTHASVGVAGGLSLPIVGALLGHSQPATTQRYAHLADDPVRRGADYISGEIAALLEGREPAKVRELRP